MIAKDSDADAAGKPFSEPVQVEGTKELLDAVKLKPRHGRTQSDSDNSAASFDFDEERPSQDDDDIDNTPATSYGGFLSAHGDLSRRPSRSPATSPTFSISTAAARLHPMSLAGWKSSSKRSKRSSTVPS